MQDSAISAAIIAERGYCSIQPGSLYDWRQIAGSIHADDLLKRVLHQGALAFPLRRLGSETPHTWVLRPDQPREKDGKPIKYEMPRGVPNILDILQRYRAALGNPAIDIWLTEGAKKADALATAYDGLIVPVNENGVWGWRSKGKILDDFRSIVWEGRRVVLAPDGDVRHNKAVYQAVQRSAKLFAAWGAAEVLICLLPCEKNGPKLGVDDFLALGKSIDELEGHLVELTVVGEQTRVSLMRHPVTNTPLFLPPGYDVQNRLIVRREGEEARHLYTGMLAITEVGTNPVTKEESVTVVYDRYGRLQNASVPRGSLTSGIRVADALGSVGANVHSVNAREISRYLVEFIRENEAELPTYYQIDRLGNVGDGLVLPAGAINFDREVRYGGPTVAVGTDHNAYPLVLREAARWEGSLVTFWAVLGLALAAPVLNRMRPDRNPVLLLSNASGSGKTTIVNFGIGAYGDPLITPLRSQCGSRKTTATGVIQTLSVCNGVPHHAEDVHVLMRREPDRFAGMIYDFANGQLRTIGTLDQKGGGGSRLGGALLMTGEAMPELDFEGSQRRLMTINCLRYPPLGCEAKSDEGGLRAAVLGSAYKAGAGSFGHRVCETIWENWDAFERDVALHQADPAMSNLQAWGPLLATALQTLRVALIPLGITLDWGLLIKQWAALYQQGQAERDPAQLAFEKVITMLSQSEHSNNSDMAEGSHGERQTIAATWEWLSYDRKMVAARRIGEDFWRVLTTSPQWKAVVGEGAVDMFGETWLKQGLLRAHKGARAVSDKAYTGPGKGILQCILVPTDHLPSDID